MAGHKLNVINLAGTRIRQARERKQVSREQLALAIMPPDMTISELIQQIASLEAGNTEKNLGLIYTICCELDLDIAEIIGKKRQHQQHQQITGAR